MLQTILRWLGLSNDDVLEELDEVEKIEPTMSIVYNEEELIGMTVPKLKQLGQDEFGIKFPSSDRKAEVIARILDAQEKES